MGNIPQYIIHFGLSQKQLRILEDSLPPDVILHNATACATDIIALCPVFAAIINPAAMREDDLQMLVDYYNEVGWAISELVVFTARTATTPSISKILCITDADFTSERLEALFIQAASKNKRNAGYHARLALCLTILKKIQNHPGISTKILAEQCEVSEKSILRYIETLRVSGEWIEYDRLSRGWKLHPEFTSFFN